MERSFTHLSGLAVMCSFCLAPVPSAYPGWDDPVSLDPSAASDEVNTGRIEMHTLSPSAYSRSTTKKEPLLIPNMDRTSERPEMPLSRYAPDPAFDAMMNPPVVVEEEDNKTKNWILPPRPSDLEDEPDILDDPYGALEYRLHEMNEETTDALEQMFGSGVDESAEERIRESDPLDDQLSSMLGAMNPFEDQGEEDRQTDQEYLEEAGLVENYDGLEEEESTEPEVSATGYEPVLSTTSFEDDVREEDARTFESTFTDETKRVDLDDEIVDVIALSALETEGRGGFQDESAPGMFEAGKVSRQPANLPRSAETLAKIRAEMSGWESDATTANVGDGGEQAGWKNDMPFLAGTFQKAIRGVQPSPSMPERAAGFSSPGAGQPRGLGPAISEGGFRPVNISPDSGLDRGVLGGGGGGTFGGAPAGQAPRVLRPKRGFDARNLEPLLN